jgi:glycosyltransferase involved in cell wall biosynthesis
MSKNPKGVFVCGNFLSRAVGTRGAGEELSDRLEKLGWQVVRASRQRNPLAKLGDMLLTALTKRNAYDVAAVEIYSGPAFVWAEGVCFLLCCLRKPIVMTLHGGNLAHFSRGREKRVRRLLRKAYGVTTPSHFLQEALKPLRGDIAYLPNAIEVGHYSFRARQTLAPKMVWLRALHEIYEPQMAVKVLAQLQIEFPALRLAMVGPDKGVGEQVKSLAQSLNVSETLELVGSIPKDKVPEALNEHDIFLNTTKIESFGVSVLEAAACGLCIVTTDAGELPYLWQHEHDALIVPVGDADAMANAVRRLLTEPELAARLSANARLKAESLQWETVLPQWEQLLSRAAN